MCVGAFALGAVAADLDDVLTDAQDSTYTASRLIVSVWGGQTQVTKELVEHADGMEMVRRDAGWSMAGNGKAASMGEATLSGYLPRLYLFVTATMLKYSTST